VSKVGEDLTMFQYFRNFGIKTERVRLFNCTGTRKVHDITADFTYRAVELEKQGDNHLVVGNLTALRAIIDARDVCQALIVLGEKGVPGEAYNICSSHIFKMTHVVECIEKVMGTKYVLVQDPKLLRPADERLYAGNCDKIKALGWAEQYEYEDTVRAMIAYWRAKLH
jgi:GDP-4-dehydro-6-deoxy-D-mannose reductase